MPLPAGRELRLCKAVRAAYSSTRSYFFKVELMKPATSLLAGGRQPVLLCFSHLRWNFVYQRPQHLITRFARDYSVLYFEEPLFDARQDEPHLEEQQPCAGLRVLVPHLMPGQGRAADERALRSLLDAYLAAHPAKELHLWYYTPMSLAFSEHLQPVTVVYDCMDELSAFHGAPPELIERERRLMRRADVVFTGGHSLYESKRKLHSNVHLFPSSVDVAHFAQARAPGPEPADQAGIPGPRLGFYGVLDERLDTALLDELAVLRPDWHFVMVGPVVKIDPACLPRRPNIHYLGAKTYETLPAYLAGWDVALMPFAMNESTRFISPTKTPEYLAGGRAVVSTPVPDVLRSYGDCGLVHIAATAGEFVQAIERELPRGQDREDLCRQADAILASMSWDDTWRRMRDIMIRVRRRRAPIRRRYDYLIVGAGFAGSVLAERLAAGQGKKVLVIDKRPHIAGNAYDYHNEAGILVHKYGPHIFHTNCAKVVGYLSRFTDWRPYEHRVLASVDGKLVPMPINLTTLSLLYGRRFTSGEATAFLAARAEPVGRFKTSEDVVVGTVGRELYEKFFRGYTRKQWGLDPSQLDSSVTSRVPTRTSQDDRYFTDAFQCMPRRGYTAMFEKMLDHPNIEVMTGTDYEDVRDLVDFGHLIYCGPIDEFFEYCYGKLPYRSLQFQHETLEQPRFQPVAVVNCPSEDVPYTRITEYKYLTGQQHDRTSITYEFPSAQGDPYYPVPRPENAALYRRYQMLADRNPGVTFVGRLGSYRYYNMDQVVAQALSVYERLARGRKQAAHAQLQQQYAM